MSFQKNSQNNMTIFFKIKDIDTFFILCLQNKKTTNYKMSLISLLNYKYKILTLYQTYVFLFVNNFFM